jgi:exodeoxyribonuclease VII large subunit
MTLLSENESTEYLYSISEITQEVKSLLENSFPPLWIQGEISNFIHHNSGHMYFSLKDGNAQISAVMWRAKNSRLSFYPGDGKQIKAFGSLKLYEKRGTYQFDVLNMVPLGIGELSIAFEALKNKLQNEGLFEPERKKNLPKFPKCIGIVTSATGAAVHDLINVLRRRFPQIDIILRPTKVQGPGAAEEIADAIFEFNNFGNVDVLIIGRGGGSLEDLWAFNEEVVARAIFNSNIPIVSAVGHEIDFTISDFVADVRAATPSVAAELVVPNAPELRHSIESVLQKCTEIISADIRFKKEKYSAVLNQYGLRRPLDNIYQNKQLLDEFMERCQKAVSYEHNTIKNQLESALVLLDSLRPSAILNRGYSITRKRSTGEIVVNAKKLEKDEILDIEFSHGMAQSKVVKIKSQKRE